MDSAALGRQNQIPSGVRLQRSVSNRIVQNLSKNVDVPADGDSTTGLGVHPLLHHAGDDASDGVVTPVWFDVFVPGDGVHAAGGGGEVFNSCEPWLRCVSDGLLFELGFVQSLSAMLTAFSSAHAWALALAGTLVSFGFFRLVSGIGLGTCARSSWRTS